MAASVEVIVLTYNSSKYIRECLRSALCQKGVKDYSIAVYDDASTDRTVEIIESEFRNINLRLVKRPANVGVVANLLAAVQSTRSDYIALLAGDDYWTSDKKIYQQLKELEERKDLVLVGDRSVNVHVPIDSKNILSCRQATYKQLDLIHSNPFHASNVLFRNVHDWSIPSFVYTFTGGDRALFLHLSNYGTLRLSERVTGYYRVHEESVTGKRRVLGDSRLAYFEVARNALLWNEHFNGKYDVTTKAALSAASFNIIRLWKIRDGLAGAFRVAVYVQWDVKRGWRRRLVSLIARVLARSEKLPTAKEWEVICGSKNNSR
jgi:glycosyltransferase involved in cell wall biosynthesis